MAYGQLTHRESVSNALICLKEHKQKLYHTGIGKVVSKSTLTRANEHRDYRLYQDLALLLIAQAKVMYAGKNQLSVNISNHVYAIDATTIDLCLSVFYWATFRSTKAGIKLHTMLDLKTSIPEWVVFSAAVVNDVNALDAMTFVANSIYILDRGYVDLKRLYKIHLCDAFFITRAKCNINFRRITRILQTKKKM
jgi:hypothetical protein